MTISELAARVGVSVYTLRWYESIGVLPAPARQANRYRRYTPADLAHVRLVVTLRRLGLSPEQAGRLAMACLERSEIDDDLTKLVARQRQVISRRREDLNRLEGELLDLELTLAAAARAREARGQDRRPSDLPIRVLFASNFNAARGPMAEALLTRYGGPDFAPESAGAQPRGLDVMTIAALAEIGLDWRSARSKRFEEFAGQHFDYVITLSDRGRETRPTFTGVYTALHWGLPDPNDVEGDRDRLDAFRRTRNELSKRLPPFIEVALRAAGRTAGQDFPTG